MELYYLESKEKSQLLYEDSSYNTFSIEMDKFLYAESKTCVKYALDDIGGCELWKQNNFFTVYTKSL